jgi:hypothetical protein
VPHASPCAGLCVCVCVCVCDALNGAEQFPDVQDKAFQAKMIQSSSFKNTSSPGTELVLTTCLGFWGLPAEGIFNSELLRSVFTRLPTARGHRAGTWGVEKGVYSPCFPGPRFSEVVDKRR